MCWLVMAYVAMGGDADKGGYVDRDKLIQVIKHEFNMTINIEVSDYFATHRLTLLVGFN